jgi:hypothetical protein
MHWGGIAWTAATTTSYQLRGIWGSSASDVWAVGMNGAVVHWDDKTWTSLSAGPRFTNYRGVGGTGPNDVWFVADGGVLWQWGVGPSQALTNNDLSAVVATSSGEVWAVGAGGTILRHPR